MNSKGLRLFVRTFLLGGIVGGLYVGFYFGGGELASAVWIGVIAGILVGLFSAIAATYRENRVSESGPVLADEILLHEGRATHDGMSGWLYLTDRRVLFEGYASDGNLPEILTLFERFPDDTSNANHVAMPVLRISDVRPTSLGFFPGVDVVLDDGRKLFFATEDPVEWVDEISTARQKHLDEPIGENMKLFP